MSTSSTEVTHDAAVTNDDESSQVMQLSRMSPRKIQRSSGGADANEERDATTAANYRHHVVPISTEEDPLGLLEKSAHIAAAAAAASAATKSSYHDKKQRQTFKSDELRREERLAANRRSASESRKRKKELIDELQQSVAGLTKANVELSTQNEELKRLLERGSGLNLPGPSVRNLNNFSGCNKNSITSDERVQGSRAHQGHMSIEDLYGQSPSLSTSLGRNFLSNEAMARSALSYGSKAGVAPQKSDAFLNLPSSHSAAALFPESRHSSSGGITSPAAAGARMPNGALNTDFLPTLLQSLQGGASNLGLPSKASLQGAGKAAASTSGSQFGGIPQHLLSSLYSSPGTSYGNQFDSMSNDQLVQQLAAFARMASILAQNSGGQSLPKI